VLVNGDLGRRTLTRKRLMMVLLAAVGLGLTAVPVRAEEVPPSPLPIVNYGALIGSIPPLPVSAEGGEVTARSACSDGYELIFGQRRADVCTQTAAQESHCYYIDIEPAFSTNGTRVLWKPYFQAGCYVRPGTTIEATYTYQVTSSLAGTVGNDANVRYISASKKQFGMGIGGQHDCVRTAGTYEVITLTARVRAGGVDQSASFQVVCN